MEGTKGLYILASTALDELNIIKFGMSECLENRNVHYKSVFKNPYYVSCYVLSDESVKSHIMRLERIVLNKTLQYKTNTFASEYRKMEFTELNKIVCDTLKEHNIEYIYHEKPLWEYISTYKCSLCNNMFDKKSHLDAHKKNKCLPIIEQSPLLKCQQKIKQSRLKHQCSTCNKIFDKKSNLNAHKNKKNKCQPIIEYIPNPTIISTNTQSAPISIANENIKYTCNYCDKSFARQDVANKHMKISCKVLKHINEEKNKQKTERPLLKYQCEICNKIFTKKSNFNTHKNRKNKCQPIVEIPIQSTKIPQKSTIISAVTQNIQIPTINENIEYTCDYCDKSFTRQDVANKHMKLSCKVLKHINEEKNKQKTECPILKYQCEICNKIFTKKSNFNAHKNRKNKCQLIVEIPIQFTKIPPKPTIISANTQNVQIPTINKNIKYTCNYCDKSFVRQDVANKHMKLNCKVLTQINEEKNKQSIEKQKIKKLEEEMKIKEE